MKIMRLITFFAGIFLFSTAYALLDSGSSAPEFEVSSGEGTGINMGTLKGKVVTIFYETKDKEVVEKNRHIKKELNLFYRQQSDSIQRQISRVAIIDCRKAFWPFKKIWKKNLVENSLKEGLTIYGDWDGIFAKNYQTADGETNFIVIDKKGVIRFSKTGMIEKNETGKIKMLLEILLKEEQ